MDYSPGDHYRIARRAMSIVLGLVYNVDAIDDLFEDASLNLTLTSISRRRLSAGEVVLKEKPLLTLTTPHTPKTLAKYVAELRQKVGKCLMMTGIMLMVTVAKAKMLWSTSVD